MTVKEIVRLWHRTQMGNMKKCRENQILFSEIMWTLYEDMEPEIFDKEV